MIAEVEATGLVDAFSADHHVIVPDRPGFGHSPRPRAIDWTPERQAQAIGAMMDAVDDRPAIVIAHSWGTLVALALALDRPDRVRALVLISGFYFPEPRSDIVLAAPAIPVVGDVMRYTISPVVGYATADKVFAKIFAPNPVTGRFKAQVPVLMGLRPWQLRAAAEEVASMHSGADRLSRRYGEIKCPVGLLAGRSDQIIDPHRQTKRLARHIPQADLRHHRWRRSYAATHRSPRSFGSGEAVRGRGPAGDRRNRGWS